MVVSLETLTTRSINRLGAVHPSLKEYTIELLKRCYQEGILVQISSGFRSNEDQAYIYGQGRPNYIWNGKVYGSTGSIVSNAPPGIIWAVIQKLIPVTKQVYTVPRMDTKQSV